MNNNPDLVAAYGDDKEKYIEHFIETGDTTEKNRVAHDFGYTYPELFTKYTGRAWIQYNEVRATFAALYRNRKEMTDADRAVIASRGGTIADDGYGGYIVSYYVPEKWYSFEGMGSYGADKEIYDKVIWDWILEYGGEQATYTFADGTVSTEFVRGENDEIAKSGIRVVTDNGWSKAPKTVRNGGVEASSEEELVEELDYLERHYHRFSNPDGYSWLDPTWYD